MRMLYKNSVSKTQTHHFILLLVNTYMYMNRLYVYVHIEEKALPIINTEETMKEMSSLCCNHGPHKQE